MVQTIYVLEIDISETDTPEWDFEMAWDDIDWLMDYARKEYDCDCRIRVATLGEVVWGRVYKPEGSDPEECIERTTNVPE